LLTEGEVLEHEAPARAEPREDCSDDRPDESKHGVSDAAAAATNRQQLSMERGCGEAQDTDRVLELVNLTSVADQPIGTFSAGHFQRLLLAFALLGRPLFDEPTTGVDEASRVGQVERSWRTRSRSTGCPTTSCNDGGRT
jgi:ABC-type molybdenum transport system ATPase subunit/photorepair protein PhrA